MKVRIHARDEGTGSKGKTTKVVSKQMSVNCTLSTFIASKKWNTTIGATENVDIKRSASVTLDVPEIKQLISAVISNGVVPHSWLLMAIGQKCEDDERKAIAAESEQRNARRRPRQ